MSNRKFILKRQMGDYEVTQRTQDGFFDANALLKLWNATNQNKQKQMSKFLESKKTKDFIETISKRECYLEIAESDISKNEEDYRISKNGIPKNSVVLFDRGKRARGVHEDGKVWMHPLLFIDFAMYLNVEFKYDVLKFVQDQLITTRNNIADQHKKWKQYMSMIGCSTAEDFANNQKVFNTACLGFHKNGVRDYLTQEQLTDMMMQETLVYQLIDIGTITDKNSFYQYCKKLFFLRFGDKVIKERAQLPAA